MPAPKNLNPPNTEVILTFSAHELSQLEAFADLHGESVAAFVQRAALDAARITSTNKSSKGNANDPSALWLTEGFADASEAKESVPHLYALVNSQKAPGAVAVDASPEEAEAVEVTPASTQTSPKRGVVGEQSNLAHGHGMVWEIRRALGKERVHGLGWTREQLAFVLKLSVVGVRKMEHQGTTPIKSLESRWALLGLARTLENPSPEIAGYIEREEATLG